MKITRAKKLARELYETEPTEEIMKKLTNCYGVEKETGKCRYCYKLSCNEGESESLKKGTCLFERVIDDNNVGCADKMLKWLEEEIEDEEEELCY